MRWFLHQSQVIAVLESVGYRSQSRNRFIRFLSVSENYCEGIILVNPAQRHLIQVDVVATRFYFFSFGRDTIEIISQEISYGMSSTELILKSELKTSGISRVDINLSMEI